MSTKMMKLIAGLDIGNGYVKGMVSINGQPAEGIDYLSGVAIQTNSHGIKTKTEEAGALIQDIFNHMEASLDSNAVESKTVRLFGKRGVDSGKSMEEFDVSSTISKANQDLSGILVIGSLAGKVLQEYYKVNGHIPTDTVQAEARIALALPITEYKHYRQTYAERFKTGTHMVSIHNFEQTVRIELTITDVQVTAEGASAQYAIVQKGPVLMDAMLKDLRAHGEALTGITSQDILAAENTIGIDIGEGTVNFPVFQSGRFNADVSLSFAKGYGTVLEQARERLMERNMQFPSRKSLADFLVKQPSALQRQRYNAVMQVVNEEIQGFVMELIQEFRKVMSKSGSYTEVIYVYGGGATPVKETLYPELLNVVKNLGGADMSYPVLYLDSQYSRYLNRQGLYIIADKVAQAAALAAAAPVQAKK